MSLAPSRWRPAAPGASPAVSVALTGVEAIANGVPGVQAAGSEERRQHDGDRMAVLLGVLFVG